MNVAMCDYGLSIYKTTQQPVFQTTTTSPLPRQQVNSPPPQRVIDLSYTVFILLELSFVMTAGFTYVIKTAVLVPLLLTRLTLLMMCCFTVVV